jgi:hypothetical protein
MNDAAQWKFERPIKWLDHSQLEMQGELGAGAKFTAYVNLRGYVDIGNGPGADADGQVVIVADKPLAFSVEEWRSFAAAVEAAMAVDERYQAEGKAIAELYVAKGEIPDWHEIEAVMEQLR